MKRLLSFNIIFLVIVILFNSMNRSDILSDNNIIGRWKNKDMIITFKPGQEFQIEILNQENEVRFKTIGSFNLNNQKKPNLIDLKNISNFSGSLHGIIKKSENSELILSKFSPSWRLRPVSFDKYNIMVLKKCEIGNECI